MDYNPNNKKGGKNEEDQKENAKSYLRFNWCIDFCNHLSRFILEQQRLMRGKSKDATPKTSAPLK